MDEVIDAASPTQLVVEMEIECDREAVRRRDRPALLAVTLDQDLIRSEIATGGAIPLVKAISEGVPDATMFVFGATDSFANIHGPDERLLVDEWEKAVLAETLFFQELADRAKGRR